MVAARSLVPNLLFKCHPPHFCLNKQVWKQPKPLKSVWPPLLCEGVLNLCLKPFNLFNLPPFLSMCQSLTTSSVCIPADVNKVTCWAEYNVAVEPRFQSSCKLSADIASFISGRRSIKTFKASRSTNNNDNVWLVEVELVSASEAFRWFHPVTPFSLWPQFHYNSSNIYSAAYIYFFSAKPENESVLPLLCPPHSCPPVTWAARLTLVHQSPPSRTTSTLSCPLLLPHRLRARKSSRISAPCHSEVSCHEMNTINNNNQSINKLTTESIHIDTTNRVGRCFLSCSETEFWWSSSVLIPFSTRFSEVRSWDSFPREAETAGNLGN